MGCTCPVMDNCHGRYPPWPPNGWWITESCPLHGPKATEDLARWEGEGGAV